MTKQENKAYNIVGFVFGVIGLVLIVVYSNWQTMIGVWLMITAAKFEVLVEFRKNSSFMKVFDKD